jgi:hypothetical protein
MWFEATRKILQLPTRSQWAKWALPSRQTTLSYIVGVLGIAIGFIWWRWPYSPTPPVKAYELDAPRRAKFISLLQIPSDANFRRLRIGCVAWSETSCLTAGHFLKLFSEAGWQIEAGRVFKMEPSIPVDGLTIADRSDDVAHLPQLPPHLGRWVQASVSQSVITAAFRFMDNPVKFSRDPSLSDGTLGIYFGTEPLAVSAMSVAQKAAREPLLTFIKSGEVLKHQCLSEQSSVCFANYSSWTSSVNSHLKSNGFDQNAAIEWAGFPGDPSARSIEKKQDFLIRLSLRIGEA